MNPTNCRSTRHTILAEGTITMNSCFAHTLGLIWDTRHPVARTIHTTEDTHFENCDINLLADDEVGLAAAYMIFA